LCEDLRALLDELQSEYSFAIEEIDITRSEELFERYRYDIPVLMKDGAEIARGRISDRELVEVLGLKPEA
jgi:hypothetical protein